MVIHAKFGVPKWCLDEYGEDEEAAKARFKEALARRLDKLDVSDCIDVEVEPTDGDFYTSIFSEEEDSNSRKGSEHAEEEEEKEALQREGCFGSYSDEGGSAPAHARNKCNCEPCLSWRRNGDGCRTLSNHEKSLAKLKLWGMLCLDEDEELHNNGGTAILTVPEKRYLREMLKERTDISEILARLDEALFSD